MTMPPPPPVGGPGASTGPRTPSRQRSSSVAPIDRPRVPPWVLSWSHLVVAAKLNKLPREARRYVWEEFLPHCRLVAVSAAVGRGAGGRRRHTAAARAAAAAAKQAADEAEAAARASAVAAGRHLPTPPPIRRRGREGAVQRGIRVIDPDQPLTRYGTYARALARRILDHVDLMRGVRGLVAACAMISPPLRALAWPPKRPVQPAQPATAVSTHGPVLPSSPVPGAAPAPPAPTAPAATARGAAPHPGAVTGPLTDQQLVRRTLMLGTPQWLAAYLRSASATCFEYLPAWWYVVLCSCARECG